MRPRRIARRALGIIVHDWPLKVGAIVLASLLYVGLVATQDTNTYPGPIPVVYVHLPAGTVVTNQLKDVEQVRYIAPVGVGNLTASDFTATVDLANMPATGLPTSVPIVVQANDPRVAVVDIRPRTVSVVLDESLKSTVPVNVVRAAAAPGVTVGDTSVTPEQATILGPGSAVNRVVAVQVNVTLDPTGLDFDREVAGVPVDASGTVVTGVQVLPRTIHVTIPQITNKQTRTLPVNPVLTGTPSPGFRISGIEVQPLTVLLQGDANQLVKLTQVDTAPIAVFGATRDASSIMTLALPTGVVPVGPGTVSVTVHVTAVTDTRTLTGGLRLDGQDPGFAYSLPVSSVLLTLFGSSADLDRLGAAPVVVALDVAGMGPGAHRVTVVPSLPSGITVVSISPAVVTVTITTPATPTPAPTTSPSTPEATPSPS
jgi:YbbR domain-containing protein